MDGPHRLRCPPTAVKEPTVISFFYWLRRQRGRDDQVGDLAHDASADRRFPRVVRSQAELRGYLQIRGACDGAHKAANAAWREWKKYQRMTVAQRFTKECKPSSSWKEIVTWIYYNDPRSGGVIKNNVATLSFTDGSKVTADSKDRRWLYSSWDELWIWVSSDYEWRLRIMGDEEEAKRLGLLL